MRQLVSTALVPLFLFASLAAPARAGDETVLAADVPGAVKASVEKKVPASTAGRWFVERGSGDKIVIYETKAVVTAKDAAGAETKREVALRLTPEGRIVYEQEAIPVDKVPDAVKKGFDASPFGKGTIKQVTRRVTDEKTAEAEYDFDVVLPEWEGQKGEFRFDAVFDSTGKFIEN